MVYSMGPQSVAANGMELKRPRMCEHVNNLNISIIALHKGRPTIAKPMYVHKSMHKP